jgi:hypothetical protein
MLSTDQKGSIAEAAIVFAATKAGVGVLRPLTDGERYDLVFDLRPRLVRVQCKWASREGEVVAVRCYSSRRSGTGFIKTSYSREDVDFIAAYCPELERCYLLPLDLFDRRLQVQLRLGKTRNNQRRGINWEEAFELAATLRRYRSGAVAQLGERCHGMAEVTGSSPVGSTLFT